MCRAPIHRYKRSQIAAAGGTGLRRQDYRPGRLRQTKNFLSVRNCIQLTNKSEETLRRGSQVVADFNQVEVRVSDVNRKHFAPGTVACHWPKFDGVVTGVQMRDYFLERGLGDEA